MNRDKQAAAHADRLLMASCKAVVVGGFEFIASKEWKAGFKYKDDEKVAGGVAQTAIQLPGATPLSRPLWFDFGKQKLHAAFAAFGLQNTSPDQPHALNCDGGDAVSRTHSWLVNFSGPTEHLQ